MQDRLTIDELSAQLKKQKSQLDELNFALYKSKDKDTVFENIDKRFDSIVFFFAFHSFEWTTKTAHRKKRLKGCS